MEFFLKNDIIGLRSLCVEDVNYNYSHWLNDYEICRYNSHCRFPVEKESLIDYVEKVKSSNNVLVLAVIDIENNTHIGNISLQNINYIDRNAEIAYIMGEKSYWGKGFATQASELIIKHGFEQLNLERIYCGTSDENIRMINLAKKLGFVQEGIRRRAFYKNGDYHDIIEFGLLKSEFRKDD